PELRAGAGGRGARKITIAAAGYDEIVWISRRSPRDKGAAADAPWPSGEVVQRGPVFDLTRADSTLSYVRAEVIRHTDAGPVRLLLNPFALTRRSSRARLVLRVPAPGLKNSRTTGCRDCSAAGARRQCELDRR